ncbi:pyrroline-5-carboxylate reductase 1, mitochondrial-like [Gigantopelta aegis]|uniref:pyrroline-5-carboxylate reductase 1, mitochondrial-like n=1 Tax=Gigantopelta aegis TaxID=1735272 RepID=UPI001B88DDD0|nr:pyrroline-5-carboxylate reductase 1, mitochondrial-like [Gigantopelta aegis]
MSSAEKSPDQPQVDVPSDTMVGFIGAGKMAHAMAKGFILSGAVKASNIIASCPHPNESSVKDLGVSVIPDNKEVVRRSSVVVIAVKPNIVPIILKELSSIITQKNMLISIAAGIPLKTIENYLPSGSRVLRVAVNTAASVQAGVTVVAKGTATLDTDSRLVVNLMKSVGICEEGPEKYLDAVGAVSGCGVAYAFMAIEAMADGGVKMGLSRDLAIRFAAQALMGAGKMVLETGKHPGQLKDEVCSPGGTTIAAVHKLEKAGFRGALIDAVEAATLRSHELAKQ